ncbi:putative hydrolase YxeP [Anatilimnocola aggregata]|uniref:Putative hydrolase YxeP n=1 Tax=Anatilimnocola aggregata TaxID=2528021 RepID=A0A517Y5L9_9BACT|nr:amidohydrolase [Anatilimnocola aggregata]QDU25537.1 putative hydrolase YxeP [Anatilimnocola aggregata]
MMRVSALCLLMTSAVAAVAQDATLLRDVRKQIDSHYPSLETLYKHLHSHPELSLAEKETAARIALELKNAHCEVTTDVGGHGVVGVMKNGNGPTIMLRADMDALPIAERTKLPYASQVRTRDRQGRDVGVMHACGHDVNMTNLVGTARLMDELRAHWQGTIVFVGQPAEEVGAGARMMLADGLFHRFPRPEKCFALHCDARFPHGHVNYRSGQMQANVDTVDIVVLGKGGHGAAPQVTIDPVVIAARIVIDLQTIVSRELDPLDAAVVTVGSINGGTKHNVIPNEVRLQLTVRTTNDKSRQHVLEAIRRIATAAATAARAPEPTVLIDEEQFTPALVNDPEITAATVAVLKDVLGSDHVHERPMSLGGEDFSRFVLAGVPGCYYFLGTASPERVAAAKNGGAPLSLTHTDAYFPIPEPTIKTGLLTMTAVLLNATIKQK